MKDRNFLFLIASGLTLLGVIMVFSATAIFADTEYQNSFFFLRKELLWFIIGMVFLFGGYFLNLDTLKKYSPYIFAITLFLVLLTYTPLGIRIGGAKRWIRFGILNFQPSEFLKFGLTCMIGYYISNHNQILEKFWHGFLVCVSLIAVSVLVVLGQPDFGTSFMIATVGFIMLFVAGARIKYLGGMVLLSLPCLYYIIVFFPYRLRRVVAFLDPWADPQGKGFQIVQSFLAIGRGNLTGVGLGESTQKLFYLPAAHTDFIFSILAEELGFVGGVSVILAFIAISVIGYSIAMRARNIYETLLAVSCSSYITIQALFNIAVVTGSVPTKGIPLPFISFGGSSLAINLFAIGLIMNVSKQRDWAKNKEQIKHSPAYSKKNIEPLIAGVRNRKPAWI